MSAHRVSRRTRLVIVATALLTLSGAVLWATDVDTALTSEDRASIEGLGVRAVCEGAAGFAQQLACIRAIQAAHLAAAPELVCVDEYGVTSHEPPAFLARRRGCCYDRSRFVEKAASFYGLEVRHLAIYHARSSFDLVRGGTPSHSLSEVLTDRGWMVVDSNTTALGLRTDGTPLDAAELSAALRAGGSGLESTSYREFFGGDYVSLYGVYSRHGGFYPPYVRLPDIDWAQVDENF